MFTSIPAFIYYKMLCKALPDKFLPYRVAGGKIYLNIAESPMMLMRALRLYERHKIRVIQSILKSGMTFIDVGANKGDFTLLAAKIVGDRGRVLAFEPEPGNCNWIRKSLALNQYQNVQLFETALGANNKQSYLHLGEKSGWHTLLPDLPRREAGTILIAERTLDSIIDEIKNKRSDVIKIDVEGFELEVLRGARKTLLDNQNVTLFIDIHQHLGVDVMEVINFLKNLNFSIYDMKKLTELACVDGCVKEIMARRPNIHT